MTGDIARLEDIEIYAQPGHFGAAGGRFEMVHGRLVAGGVTDRHAHQTERPAMMVLAGACDVTLSDAAPERAEAGAVVRIPPGVEHHVASLGPEDLQLVIACSTPIARTP